MTFESTSRTSQLSFAQRALSNLDHFGKYISRKVSKVSSKVFSSHTEVIEPPPDIEAITRRKNSIINNINVDEMNTNAARYATVNTESFKRAFERFESAKESLNHSSSNERLSARRADLLVAYDAVRLEYRNLGNLDEEAKRDKVRRDSIVKEQTLRTTVQENLERITKEMEDNSELERLKRTAEAEDLEITNVVLNARLSILKHKSNT